MKLRLILLALAAGFGLTMVEVRFLHRYAIQEEWWAWVPIVYCALAAFAAFLGLARAKWAQTVALIIMLAGLIVGPMGFWKHSHEKPMRALERWSDKMAKANRGEDDPRPDGPPLLAPFGILGLSLIGSIALWPSKRASE